MQKPKPNPKELTEECRRWWSAFFEEYFSKDCDYWKGFSEDRFKDGLRKKGVLLILQDPLKSFKDVIGASFDPDKSVCKPEDLLIRKHLCKLGLAGYVEELFRGGAGAFMIDRISSRDWNSLDQDERLAISRDQCTHLFLSSPNWDERIKDSVVGEHVDELITRLDRLSTDEERRQVIKQLIQPLISRELKHHRRHMLLEPYHEPGLLDDEYLGDGASDSTTSESIGPTKQDKPLDICALLAARCEELESRLSNRGWWYFRRMILQRSKLSDDNFIERDKEDYKRIAEEASEFEGRNISISTLYRRLLAAVKEVATILGIPLEDLKRVLGLTQKEMRKQHKRRQAHFFATVFEVDADQSTIAFSVTNGKEKGRTIRANVAQNCVIRNGFLECGKPFRRQEGELIVNGLRNDVFQELKREGGLKVNVFTAGSAEKTRGISQGDVIKILVNPRA